ncbi:phage holin family protein [Ruminococcaceae bacterium OttesenSCG-928-D13]|nr:phage holin family protein [Ruminococcaceae bacterium OttesenSCG-928-D13]
MDNIIGKAKVAAVGILSVLAARFGILVVPFGLLVASNVIDYATGMMAAKCRGETVNSSAGFKGIAKKICMWLLVVVAMIADVALAYGVDALGWNLPFSFLVSCLACLWQLANELLSIIENISDTGVNIPPFLRPLVEWVKKKCEPEIDKDDKE